VYISAPIELVPVSRQRYLDFLGPGILDTLNQVKQFVCTAFSFVECSDFTLFF
jgi:hypothetical protein